MGVSGAWCVSKRGGINDEDAEVKVWEAEVMQGIPEFWTF